MDFFYFSELGFFQDKEFAHQLTFSGGTAASQAQEHCAIPSFGLWDQFSPPFGKFGLTLP